MSHLRRLKQKLGVDPSARPMRDSQKLLKRMPREHQDVLQNIEFILISGYREDQSIDDRIIAEALKAAVGGDMPEDGRAQSLKGKLKAMREFRCDVSDDIWRDGLRTILQSVHRHSGLARGEREYLDFVSEFIL